MAAYRKGLPRLPARMNRLALDDRGYPVPWFVAYPDGEHPDFRVANASKLDLSMRFGNCWVCGEVVGRYRTFVIGPMCVVNRTTAEPPCHLDCAQYSAIACPFLTLPKAQRNEAGLPESSTQPAGEMIRRNPGVVCLWTCLEYERMRVSNGFLFRLKEPSAIEWYANGRRATRAEIVASIDSGMPILEAMARQEGERALNHLAQEYLQALVHLPAEASA